MPGETVENYLLLIELARQEDTLKQMTKKTMAKDTHKNQIWVKPGNQETSAAYVYTRHGGATQRGLHGS